MKKFNDIEFNGRKRDIENKIRYYQREIKTIKCNIKNQMNIFRVLFLMIIIFNALFLLGVGGIFPAIALGFNMGLFVASELRYWIDNKFNNLNYEEVK